MSAEMAVVLGMIRTISDGIGINFKKTGTSLGVLRISLTHRTGQDDSVMGSY